MPTTSQRQGRSREGWSGGSRRQTREPTNRNVIAGRGAGASEHKITKPRGVCATVNGAVVRRQFTRLSGESCLTGGTGYYGSRTEGQPERTGITIGPYRSPDSAPSGNVRRDGTAVSRRHSSPTLTVMGGTWRRPEPSATRETNGPQRLYRTRPGEMALAVRPVASVGGRHPRVALSHPKEAPRSLRGVSNGGQISFLILSKMILDPFTLRQYSWLYLV